MTSCHRVGRSLSLSYERPNALSLSFVSLYVDWKFLIIALMVKIGFFTALALFLKPLH